MYKLAIFDLDGTILNTLKDLQNSVNYSLDKFGFPHRKIEEVASFMGNGIRRLCELSLPKDTDIKIIDEFFEIFNEHYAIHCNDYTKPYDGIIEVMKILKNKGVIVSVVSNKSDYAVQPLLKNHFNNLVEYGVGLKEGIRKKPYPDSCLQVMNKFNIDKKDAIYIGDTEVDIETANNVGIKCISVTWGYRSKEELKNRNSNIIVDDMNELCNTILK